MPFSSFHSRAKAAESMFETLRMNSRKCSSSLALVLAFFTAVAGGQLIFSPVADAQFRMRGFAPSGSYCPVPQYPSFSYGAPHIYRCPPSYLPGGCMPGFYPGCVPFAPRACPYPIFFGPSFITQSINCIDIPAGDFHDGTTGSGRSSSSRIEQLLPSLPNDREIPDTTRSTNTDISSVIGDVFKNSSPRSSDRDCSATARLCKEAKFEEALHLIDKEAGEHELGAACSYVRANANLGLGKFVDALEDIHKAIKQRPDYPANFFTEGAILASMNRLDDAV